MHVATTLLTGQIADDMDLPDDERTMLTRIVRSYAGASSRMARSMANPSPKGSPPATAGFATRAVPVEGGYRVTGRKIFASLSGAAGIHNVVCSVEGDPRLRLLGIPADGEGSTSKASGTSGRATDSAIW